MVVSRRISKNAKLNEGRVKFPTIDNHQPTTFKTRRTVLKIRRKTPYNKGFSFSKMYSGGSVGRPVFMLTNTKIELPVVNNSPASFLIS